MGKQLEFKFKEEERIQELKKDRNRNFLAVGIYALANIVFLEGVSLCDTHPEYIETIREYIKSIF
jgi:hypothetical protein